ncbi:hypothetical protein F7734_58770 [Scytonema sp. UIC 10036]|nr:hypothetical protein [Scytonema sp. UIC 10036]MUH01590.1 hypothetical protein [Scytonema sp. UIC 10036]
MNKEFCNIVVSLCHQKRFFNEKAKYRILCFPVAVIFKFVVRLKMWISQKPETVKEVPQNRQKKEEIKEEESITYMINRYVRRMFFCYVNGTGEKLPDSSDNASWGVFQCTQENVDDASLIF